MQSLQQKQPLSARQINFAKSTATFSDCGRYRYLIEGRWNDIERRWNDGSICAFVGLNPSTATANSDDATIRKCLALARTWGFSGMTMTNLFAVRCRYPQVLSTHQDPVGPENDRFLLPVIEQAHTVVAMWGNHGLKSYGQSTRRDQYILSLRDDWQCIGITKQGAPRHPLYAASSSNLANFTEELSKFSHGQPRPEWSGRLSSNRTHGCDQLGRLR